MSSTVQSLNINMGNRDCDDYVTVSQLLPLAGFSFTNSRSSLSASSALFSPFMATLTRPKVQEQEQPQDDIAAGVPTPFPEQFLTVPREIDTTQQATSRSLPQDEASGAQASSSRTGLVRDPALAAPNHSLTRSSTKYCLQSPTSRSPV